MFKNKNKNKKNDSVFSQQNTKFQFKKFIKRAKTPIIFLTIIVVLCLLFLGYKYVDNKLYTYFNQTDTPEVYEYDWNISFLTKGYDQLNEKEQNYIKQQLLSLPKLKNSLIKEKILSIKKQLHFKEIHAFKPNSNSIIISATKLKPILSIKVSSKKYMYLTEERYIYGDSSKDSSLPLVENISIKNPHIDESSGYLFLDEEEFSLIDSAVSLYKDLISSEINITPSKISYIFNRGFSFTIKDSGSEIILGLAPFKNKLLQLNNILKDKNPNTSLSVELDYNNKAFIKEKSL